MGLTIAARPRKLRLVLRPSFPLPDDTRHRLQRSLADQRDEPAHQHAVTPSDGCTTKIEAQERKACNWVLLIAPVLFAVDDASLIRVAAQPELQQPFFDDMADIFRLPLAKTVQDNVIAVPLELHHREIPGKPGIQRVVQEEI